MWIDFVTERQLDRIWEKGSPEDRVAIRSALIEKIATSLADPAQRDALINDCVENTELRARFDAVGQWCKRVLAEHEQQLAAERDRPRQKRSPWCDFGGCQTRVHDDSRHLHVSWYRDGARYYRAEFCSEAHAAAHLWFELSEETRLELTREQAA